MSKGSRSQLLNKGASCPVCKKHFPTYNEMFKHKTTAHKPVSTRRSSTTTANDAIDIAAATEVGDNQALFENESHDSAFSCHICGRSFARKMHLGSHMRIHENST